MNYIFKFIVKMQQERYKSVVVKQEAVDGMMAYADAYLPRTVHTADCNSWYKNDGKVRAIWPGSVIHMMHAMEQPRWEVSSYYYYKILLRLLIRSVARNSTGSALMRTRRTPQRDSRTLVLVARTRSSKERTFRCTSRSSRTRTRRSPRLAPPERGSTSRPGATERKVDRVDT